MKLLTKICEAILKQHPYNIIIISQTPDQFLRQNIGAMGGVITTHKNLITYKINQYVPTIPTIKLDNEIKN